MSDLTEKKCTACESGVSSLPHDQIEALSHQLNGWTVVNDHQLEKVYTFPDFRQALNFTNLIGELAEKEGHHPDIELSWGKVKVTTWTHKVDGLTENDFILAAKCDEEITHLTQKACF